jgi:HD-GYP domain-containing protein (c-di-GMP phosphodiesterase class II)
VPVSLSDGSVFGTFCVLSHEPNPALRERDVRLMGVLARLIADQLEQEERARREWSRAAAAGSVQALLSALEARDGYTEAHSHAVVELAVRVGRRLGVDDAELTELEWAALLHDIGKLGVADAILRKPGPLDDGEWAEMRRHPEIGERIVASIELLAHLAPTIRAEHERWDGGGYPDGLRGEEIPLASRIVLVCDAFHAMTSDRPYRVAMPVEDALEQLREHAGTQFCPRVCAAVLDLVAEERAAA